MLAPGQRIELTTKGVSFGTLARYADGSWDTAFVQGLPTPSLASSEPDDPPNLIIRPFHQSGAVVSLREFTNNAMNHHHGIQTTEQFGEGVDADGDGFVNELSRADVTAATLYQATLGVPGRVAPHNRRLAAAAALGEARFEDIGCGKSHVSRLPLDHEGLVFIEPNRSILPEICARATRRRSRLT